MKLKAEIVGWSEQAALDFSKRGVVPEGDPTIGPDFYAQEAQSGRVTLLQITADGAHVGHVTVFVEPWPKGKEMVVQAAAGFLKGVDLTEAVLPAIEAYARSKGCISVRFHTTRVGLVKKTKRLGYEVSETVMRKVL